ncbi:uncharacterized protein LOC122253741 [Penaeus japonicus]|uniref:uncharacterized protein LOC122253741 n=1 Tax=Penaeus japonicus TaxID=27405 RepID=UPI001C70EAC4|nr:uncharacterized protein LOC122253741 [Penaeus japonicus]
MTIEGQGHIASLVILAVAVLVTARPDVLSFEGDEHQHQQEGDAGDHVEGSYSWTSPEGLEFYVKYVADEDGYRVMESNAVPVNHDGMAADGNQGAFENVYLCANEEVSNPAQRFYDLFPLAP